MKTFFSQKVKLLIKDLAYSMDTNESGTIDLPEFLNMMAAKIREANVEGRNCRGLPRLRQGRKRFYFRARV